MDFGLINDEANPEADNLKKRMYGFGFWDKTNVQIWVEVLYNRFLLGYAS